MAPLIVEDHDPAEPFARRYSGMPPAPRLATMPSNPMTRCMPTDSLAVKAVEGFPVERAK